jgi:hypothetical protein
VNGLGVDAHTFLILVSDTTVVFYKRPRQVNELCL